MTSINLKDNNEHPPMTKWFSIPILLNSAKQAFISGIFGLYADRRLIHAALDDIKDSDLYKKIDFTDDIKPNENDEIWVDYVSDLGDGFDSTYTIAYLLGKKELEFKGKKLPRGQLLIMGGDEVYPTPTKDNYKYRLENPYAYAFPKSTVQGAENPPVFLIPGNHDWYDGIRLFLAKFCHGKSGFLGSADYKSSWRLFQTRSYFAIKLHNNWWIWGVDTQLGRDIDKPQADFFSNIANQYMKSDKEKIILCTAEPTWLYDEGIFDTGIGSIVTDIIKDKAKIYTVLTGDLHHYNRYEVIHPEAPKSQFITAGGGGAFLHPTHHLKDESTSIYWLPGKVKLKLAQNGENKACYPSLEKSRELSKSIWKNFPKENFEFCLLLAIPYIVIALILIKGQINPTLNFFNYLISPIFWFVYFVLAGFFSLYALHEDNDVKPFEKCLYGFTHAMSHLLLVLFLIYILFLLSNCLTTICAISKFNSTMCSWSWFFLITIVFVIGGIVGGYIWGAYLWIASHFKRHHNDSFGCMGLSGYKNFLRMCIKENTLTIYPIGVDKILNRGDWQTNEDPKVQSRVVPKNNDPVYRVIENEPIVINLVDQDNT